MKSLMIIVALASLLAILAILSDKDSGCPCGDGCKCGPECNCVSD